jgi:hypothetical protein
MIVAHRLRAVVLLLALGGCHDDDGRDKGSSSGSTGPNFTVCTPCPIGGPVVCPAGQVCASITPGSGGLCMLACTDAEPEPCVFEGIVTGTCEKFSPDETRACSSPDNGPVCPPSDG